MEKDKLAVMIFEKLHEKTEAMKKEEDHKLFAVKFYYFYDGIALELGASVAMSDKKEMDIYDQYISFEDDQVLGKEIFDYLDKHSSDNEYTPALRAIARELKNTFKKQEWVKRGVLVMLEEGD